MKLKRTFAVLAVAALAALPVAGEQKGGLTYKGPVQIAKIADDTDVAIVVRYVGPATAGVDTVAVAANGDLTFIKDGAAYTGMECPVAAPLGGIIVVANAACDTLGEVVDAINSGPDFKAFILDGLRTDTSNDTLLTIGATDATPAVGLALNFDSDVAKWSSTALVECRNFSCFASGGTTLPITNPYRGYISAIQFYNEKSTWTGASDVFVYSVKPLNGAPTSETVTAVYTIAGGASTVVKIENASTFGSDGFFGYKDSKLIFRVANTTTGSAFVVYATANLFTY